MTTQEFNSTITKWRQKPTPELTGQVLGALRPTIDTAIKSFAGGDPSLHVKASNIALTALKSFDPAKGASPTTHVYNSLKRLNRVASDRSSFIHIPENVAADFSAVSKAFANLEDSLGREPTDDELADYTGLSQKRLARIARYNQPISDSSASSEEFGDAAVSKRTPERVYQDYLYSSVDPISKKIIEYSTGRNGQAILSGKQIADKLHITPAAVSQRIARMRDLYGKFKERY